jgi:hypothetical protein
MTEKTYLNRSLGVLGLTLDEVFGEPDPTSASHVEDSLKEALLSDMSRDSELVNFVKELNKLLKEFRFALQKNLVKVDLEKLRDKPISDLISELKTLDLPRKKKDYLLTIANGLVERGLISTKELEQERNRIELYGRFDSEKYESRENEIEVLTQDIQTALRLGYITEDENTALSRILEKKYRTKEDCEAIEYVVTILNVLLLCLEQLRNLGLTDEIEKIVLISDLDVRYTTAQRIAREARDISEGIDPNFREQAKSITSLETLKQLPQKERDYEAIIRAKGLFESDIVKI